MVRQEPDVKPSTAYINLTFKELDLDQQGRAVEGDVKVMVADTGN